MSLHPYNKGDNVEVVVKTAKDSLGKAVQVEHISLTPRVESTLGFHQLLELF